MFEKVKEILEQYTTKEIVPGASLGADLELTSFDLVSIISDFEDAFDVEISDRDIRKFVTVQDILNYITQLS